MNGCSTPDVVIFVHIVEINEYFVFEASDSKLILKNIQLRHSLRRIISFCRKGPMCSEIKTFRKNVLSPSEKVKTL